MQIIFFVICFKPDIKNYIFRYTLLAERLNRNNAKYIYKPNICFNLNSAIECVCQCVNLVSAKFIPNSTRPFKSRQTSSQEIPQKYYRAKLLKINFHSSFYFNSCFCFGAVSSL